MRALIICRYYFPPVPGGISRWMYDVATSIETKEVACLIGYRIANNMFKYSMPVFSTRYFSEKISYTNNVLTLFKLLSIVLIHRVKVVMFETLDCSNFGLYLKRLTGTPYIIFAHGNEIMQAGKSSWAKGKEAALGARMFIANSLFTKELIQKNFGTDSNIEIIHPCCDIERFKPSDGGEATKYEMGLSGKKILLTVGNLVMRKGHDMIIDALPRILERRPDAFYLIVGTGKDKKYLQDKVKLRGVSEHVRFEGFVEDEKLPEYYNMCDLFLMPSRERWRK